jgi:protein-tyrosine phosphatase
VTGNDEFDFDWLADDLAVGGCFPMDRVGTLAEAHEIGAIVDLRAEACDDEALLRDAGIALLHLPTPDLIAASHQHLEAGVAFVRDQLARGRKVLIHCHHGIGRSALLALCVLVDQGWRPLDALVHAKGRREVISLSRAQYDGWAAWLRARGIPPPDYHTFGCIAYRHLAGG